MYLIFFKFKMYIRILYLILKGFHSRCMLWFRSGMSAKMLMCSEGGLLEGGWIMEALCCQLISPLVILAAEYVVGSGPS